MSPMGTIKAPPLADQLCFDLYAASRAVTAAYRPVLTELGITYPQYLVLKRMETGGLIERRRGNVDERYVVVSLAARGESLRRHAERIHCDMVDRLGLVQQEFEELQDTLRLLTARVSSSAP